MQKKILLTGVAGFIGFHLGKKLISEDYKIIGIDNFSSYYDVLFKKERVNELETLSKNISDNLILHNTNIQENNNLKKIFEEYKPDIVINLAAQAGVRYSITNPEEYVSSNILGFLNILENSRKNNVEHLLYASSSSVYGGNIKTPFSEEDPANHPISFYAATKRSNELMAHNYSHQYQLPTTGMRFFTVYGPWGRPDMAPMIFADAICSKKPLKVYNKGNMSRDFTYIDDVVEYIIRLIKIPPKNNKNFNFEDNNPQHSWAPYRILNIGNGNPTKLMDFINLLEKEFGKNSEKIYEKMKQGDVKDTYANIDNIRNLTNYMPQYSIEEGTKCFVSWYKDHFKNT